MSKIKTRLILHFGNSVGWLIILAIIFSGMAAASEGLKLLKEASKHLEVWEMIYKRDYSIKNETGPIENVTKEYKEIISKAVVPYKKEVWQAARTFKVPPSIIAGLIYQESSGRPEAVPIGKNGKPLSSAKGLTQIIDSTFTEIQCELEERGIDIGDNRNNPETAIMAGAYYLSKQFDLSVKDYPKQHFDKSVNEDWCMALQYYYRGREGVKGQKVVRKIYYTDGSTTIDPDVYCQRILRHATILKKDYGFSA
ncbi:transglycosylase SLT domain-containing protein [Desulfatibacillum aliphaticivorans]|uniref:transglycosylase SLT domain-containing protein n=1 Tax=Desulfatibacillum aliphaticivorans TaxID=218208 RepID=UPI0004827195|nr:transglycosylase SLT domain-containing protein [Desulfatibacillum aliphaticivorans]